MDLLVYNLNIYNPMNLKACWEVVVFKGFWYVPCKDHHPCTDGGQLQMRQPLLCPGASCHSAPAAGHACPGHRRFLSPPHADQHPLASSCIIPHLHETLIGCSITIYTVLPNTKNLLFRILHCLHLHLPKVSRQVRRPLHPFNSQGMRGTFKSR